MSQPIKLPEMSFDFYSGLSDVNQYNGVRAYATLAVEQATAELRSELSAALTKLAHYETLRPASKHDGKSRVIVWHWTTYIDGTAEWVPQWIHSVLPNHACWTPLPDVKEAK